MYGSEWQKEQCGKKIPPDLNFSGSKHGILLNNNLIASSSSAFVDEKLIFIFCPLQQSMPPCSHYVVVTLAGGKCCLRVLGNIFSLFNFSGLVIIKNLFPTTLLILIKNRQG